MEPSLQCESRDNKFNKIVNYEDRDQDKNLLELVEMKCCGEQAHICSYWN